MISANAMQTRGGRRGSLDMKNAAALWSERLMMMVMMMRAPPGPLTQLTNPPDPAWFEYIQFELSPNSNRLCHH